MDSASLGSVLLQTFAFVLVSLLEQESSELAHMRGLHFEKPGIEPLAQREVVVAVEPCGYFRWREQMLGHRSSTGSLTARPYADTW
jgi:hypothetical protein